MTGPPLPRVFHGVQEIAGQAALSALGLRERGCDASAYFRPHAFGYALPPDLRPTSGGRIAAAAGRALDAIRFAARFDVFHFHGGVSFVSPQLGHADVRLLRRLGRKVTVEFWGSEARALSVELRRNPHYVDAYGEGVNEQANRARLQRWAELTDGHVVISDRSFHVYLEPFFPHIHVVHQRLDTRRFTPSLPSPDVRRPVVVHAPSNLAAKGTLHIRAAVEQLKSRGLDFDYVEVHGVTQSEALAIYARADLIVDQLCVGAHGLFAVEGMALGKPVICWTIDSLVETYPEGFPLINANPLTIGPVLEQWLLNPAERHRRGARSREYAERIHDCRVVADRLLTAYAALP